MSSTAEKTYKLSVTKPPGMSVHAGGTFLMMLFYPHGNPASEVTEVWLITEADLPLRKSSPS